MSVENLIIIGSGPAGLTAAIYASRANLNPLVFTGNQLGGQVAMTNEVENYPGFPEGVLGPELVERFRKQAERFGARIQYGEVTEVDFTANPLRVRSYDTDYWARAVIIATGAIPRRLGVPGEAELTGRGVSYCATCDGFFFREKTVAVIGGGDSALEEGLFLTRFARRVTIVHRRDQLRAGYILQERARNNPKVDFIWNSVVTRINGEQAVGSVTLKNVQTGQLSDLPVDGVFVFIGHEPSNQLFLGQLEMDEHGCLVVDRRNRTNRPGVFAAGEIADPIFRQTVTSAGEGAKAAMEAVRYLAELDARKV